MLVTGRGKGKRYNQSREAIGEAVPGRKGGKKVQRGGHLGCREYLQRQTLPPLRGKGPEKRQSLRSNRQFPRKNGQKNMKNGTGVVGTHEPARVEKRRAKSRERSTIGGARRGSRERGEAAGKINKNEGGEVNKNMRALGADSCKLVRRQQ